MRGRGSSVLISGTGVDRGVRKGKSETISLEMIREAVMDTDEIGEAEIVMMIGIGTEIGIGVEEETEELIAISAVNGIVVGALEQRTTEIEPPRTYGAL